MALTGVGSSGSVYRLRNAEFRVTGTSTATVLSEENLDALSVELELPAGAYLVLLRGQWSLEQ
jgi:hypothetical protein